MNRLLFLLASFILCPILNHAANSDKSADGDISIQQRVFESEDFILFILPKSQLNFADHVSMSMASKKVRVSALLAIAKIYPQGLPFNHNNAANYLEILKIIQTFTAPEWKFDGPLHVTAANDAELGPICTTLQSLPCIATTKLNVDITGVLSEPLRKIQEIIKGQPIEILKLEDTKNSHRILSDECFKEIGQAKSLKSCAILAIPLDSNAMNAIAKSDSLISLTIDKLTAGNVALELPKKLKVLNLSGRDLSGQFLSDISDLPNLSSCKIKSDYALGDTSFDLSDSIVKILKIKTVELDIQGVFSVDDTAIKAIANYNAERIILNLGLNYRGGTFMMLSLGVSINNQKNFRITFSKKDIDKAVEMIKFRLSQGKGVHLYVGDRFVITEAPDSGLAIQTDAWSVELAYLLNKLDDSTKLWMTFYQVDGFVVDQAVLSPLFKKEWQVIEVVGNFSIKQDAFLSLKDDAPDGLHIAHQAGESLSIHRKNKDGGGYAKFEAAPNSMVSRDAILALDGVAKLVRIYISGAYELIPQDLEYFAQRGFLGLNLSPVSVQAMGDSIRSFNTIMVQLDDFDENKPFIYLERYKQTKNEEAPLVVLAGQKHHSDYHNLEQIVGALPCVNTLHLSGNLKLSLPMAEALKKCTTLTKLKAFDLDPQIAAEDLPQVSTLTLAKFNADTAKLLSRMSSLRSVFVQTEFDDSDAFKEFAQNHMHISSVFMSITGDKERELSIRVISGGQLPDHIKQMAGCNLLPVAVKEDGGPMVQQETEMIFIQSDISDAELVKLQQQPGLVKLDVRSCLNISNRGIIAVLGNPTLREIILPKSQMFLAGMLQKQFSNVRVTFEE